MARRADLFALEGLVHFAERLQDPDVARELRRARGDAGDRAERGLRTTQGALIFNVSDRVASDLGIQRGDVIVQVNRTRIRGAEDAAQALNYYGGRGPIRMFVERNGQVYITDFIIR